MLCTRIVPMILEMLGQFNGRKTHRDIFIIKKCSFVVKSYKGQHKLLRVSLQRELLEGKREFQQVTLGTPPVISFFLGINCRSLIGTGFWDVQTLL